MSTCFFFSSTESASVSFFADVMRLFTRSEEDRMNCSEFSRLLGEMFKIFAWLPSGIFWDVVTSSGDESVGYSSLPTLFVRGTNIFGCCTFRLITSAGFLPYLGVFCLFTSSLSVSAFSLLKLLKFASSSAYSCVSCVDWNRMFIYLLFRLFMDLRDCCV